MTVYIVRFVSRSGGHKGFSTFETYVEASAERNRLNGKGYRVKISAEQRDSEPSVDAKFAALRAALG